jgi:nicotinamide mononucleotide (NMN) deamidase PncC
MVWIAWAVRQRGRVKVIVALNRFKGEREAIRRKTVHRALAGLLTL